MLLRLPLLLLLGVHLSTQDMVTMAPSESPEGTAMPETEAAKTKPTIRALHIVSDIKYRYATTLVSSRVINPSNQAGEAAFTVTLPESAFISEFLMEVKGKVYKAYVKEKEQAKSLYDQAVQAGHFAGHVALDARDSNQFTVSVNIEAQGKVTFNLTYEQLLSRNLGVYSNVISINPQHIVDDMSITVNIEEPTAITKLDVPEIQVSNEVLQDKEEKNTIARVEEKSPTHKQVIWAPTPEQQRSLNTTGVHGQFIVKYDVDREETPQNILVDEGYFVHFFAPENLPKLKKHVVFVLDFSASMDGRKLQQLKDAMNIILTDLDPTDYFSVVVFQSYVEAWAPNKTNIDQEFLAEWERDQVPSTNTVLDHHFIIEASPENIGLARAYLGNYSDLGSTNIMGGLRIGLKLVNIGSDHWINESDAPHPIVVFLTDGQPNVEEYDTNVIINKTKHLNIKECPIYSLAFGYGADFNFLRKLSLSNYGFARNIYEAADASEQLKNFYKTVASPLLSNVTFNYLPGQVDNSSNTKRNFPTFFRGSELVVAGKINKGTVKDKDTIGELRGVTSSGLRTYPIVINMSRTESPGHLEKTWAYLTIKQLLDKADSLDNGNEKNETKEKAKELALQYSFVTPLTSLVVVKPNETESAVETTKVKPAAAGGIERKAYAQSGGYSAAYPVPPAYSAAYPVPPAYSAAYPVPPAYSVVQRLQPMAHYPIISDSDLVDLRVENAVMGDFEDEENYATTVVNSVTSSPDIAETTELPLQKINLGEVRWLQEEIKNSNDGNITVSVQGQQYKLGMNETDQSFGNCQVKNKSGECHHFQYCALEIFRDDVSLFLPYRCPIAGDFLGVCCPEDVQ